MGQHDEQDCDDDNTSTPSKSNRPTRGICNIVNERNPRPKSRNDDNKEWVNDNDVKLGQYNGKSSNDWLSVLILNSSVLTEYKSAVFVNFFKYWPVKRG